MKSEHALRYEDACVYEQIFRQNKLYEDESISISVLNNTLVLEDKYAKRIYIVHFETSEKAVETAKTIPEILQITNISIDRLIDKLARLEKIIVENITRTFFIFRERKEE